MSTQKTKTLTKENEDYTQKERYNMFLNWKNICKMPILPKGIQRFNTIPTEIPEEFLIKLEQIILKSVQKKKKEK